MSVEKEIRKILGEATPASSRVRQDLVRAGLGHDKNAAATLAALKDPEAAMQNPAKRELLLKVMQDLLDVVVNDPSMVMKTKTALRKEEVEESAEDIQEKLVGGQKKLDKNKNGKLDAEDFKKLRGESKKDKEDDEEEEDEDEKEMEDKEEDEVELSKDQVEKMIAAMKKAKGFKAHIKTLQGAEEGFVSHAQRKAVWASRNDAKEAMKRKVKKESIEQVDEAVHRIGLTVTDPNHPMVSKRKETIQKTVRITSDDREKAINSAKAHYHRKGYKVHDHHYLGTVNEEVESLREYPEDLQKMKKADSYKVGDKIYTKVGGKWHKGHITTPLNKAGNHGVKFQHNGKTHSYVSHPDQLRLQVEEVEQVDELKKSTLASYVSKAAGAYGRDKQLIGRESPDGFVKSARPEMKRAVKNRLTGINRAAEKLAKEEVEQVDEADLMSPAETYKKLAVKHLRDSMNKNATQKQRDHAKMMNRRALEAAKMNNHTDALNHYRGMKEEVELDEGSAQDKLYQKHQAIRTANKRPNPEYYKELGSSYDIQDDKERIAKQAEIKKKYKVEGAQLDQLKTMRDDPKWQENPEHKAQLDKRFKMAKDRADLDKGEVTDSAGKPVPVLTPDKFKEKNPNFMKEEGEYPHQGVGVSKDMQMAADIARQKAKTSLLQSKYGTEFQDKVMPDYDEDKMDLKPGSSPGTYQATVRMRERMKKESFSSLRDKIAEAKKMKGEDPCWDNYKMIGTKMKGGKQVPNCVPKEETNLDSSNVLDEAKPGLYANIHAKRKRIESGSGERMRKPGSKGAPTAQAFKDSAKTAKK